MNITKKERIQKQLQKIKNKKHTLDVTLEENFKKLLDYILKNKTYINYQKIHNLLNHNDILNTYLNYISINDDNNDNDNDNNETKRNIYDKLLLNIKNITFNDFDNQELIALENKIREYNNDNMYSNNRKIKLNNTKKQLRTDYINVPTKLLNQISFEKENFFRVIIRIQELEELNNNNFCDNYYSLFLKLQNIEKSIKDKKTEINNQNNNINQMKANNLKLRQLKMKEIRNFKEQKKEIDKEKNRLDTQIKYIDTVIHENILKMNDIKIDIRLLNQKITENNYHTTIDLIEAKNNEIHLLKKKIDYLNKDKQRYTQELTNYITSINNKLDKPKAITKQDIIIEKNKLHSLISQLNNLQLNKTGVIEEQKQLILDNLNYNNTLKVEFERSKQRLIIVCKRVTDSIDTDKNKLIIKLNDIDESINIEDQNKLTNNEKIKNLNNIIKSNYKDLDFIKEEFVIINQIKDSLKNIDKDILSYNKLLN